MTARRLPRVLLLEDHPLLRRGLRESLTEKGIEVVGECESPAEVLAFLVECSSGAGCPVDLLLADLTLPGEDGAAAFPDVLNLCPAMRILVFSMHSEPVRIAQALLAGAHGYVTKNDGPEVLWTALQAVWTTGCYLPPGRAEEVQQATDELTRWKLAPFSEQERQVLVLMAQGLGRREIAERLHINTRTVDTYQNRLKRKTNLSTSRELKHFALTNASLIGIEGAVPKKRSE